MHGWKMMITSKFVLVLYLTVRLAVLVTATHLRLIFLRINMALVLVVQKLVISGLHHSQKSIFHQFHRTFSTGQKKCEATSHGLPSNHEIWPSFEEGA